jgi:hypothetical protein
MDSRTIIQKAEPTAMEEPVSSRECIPQERGTFRPFARVVVVDAPNALDEHGNARELTDEEAELIQATLVRIFSQVEDEFRRQLQAAFPTFTLRSR